MENKIAVLARVRPQSKDEAARLRAGEGGVSCDTAQGSLTVNAKPTPQTMAFDLVCGEDSSQESIFALVGQQLTEACLEGFNATILAYGQTGSGKTHTLFGGSNEARGLVPRVLEYLWASISSSAAKEDEEPHRITCSFYEIYNEKVFDLLTGDGSVLQVRENGKRGVFVEGVTEETVSSPGEAMNVLALGAKNRHVGSTAMNRESSRSHAVFTLTIDTSTLENGVRHTTSATFSLVDLAGSERQRDTHAEGVRLTEAKNINKSLLTLGNVIQALSEQSSSTTGSQKFVRYRDSALTFLLRDSLGGNSKTVLIAAVSPASDSMSETLSTLKFAQRAQTIRNIIAPNVSSFGSVEALQREIAELRSKLLISEAQKNSSASSSSSSPTMSATKRRISFGVPPRLSLGGLNSVEAVSQGSNVVVAAENLHRDQQGYPFAGLLLSEALERCQFVDDERMRAERSCSDLSSRLSQMEKLAMQTKMKLKMRDSEIQRLKKGAAEGEVFTAEEISSAEISAVREEMQIEVLKYRLRCEELERRLRAPGGGSVYDETRELNFQHDLISKVELAEKKFDALSRGCFESAVGFDLDEARSMKAKIGQLEGCIEENNDKNVSLRDSLIKMQQMLSDKELEMSAFTKTAERELRDATQRASELSGKNADIQRDLDAYIKEGQLQQKTESEAMEALKQKEVAARGEYNRAMKDNSVLLKRCSDLESSLEELQSVAKSESSRASELESKLEQAQARVAEMNSKIQALQLELANSESTISSQARIVQNLKELAERLEQQVGEITLQFNAEIRSLQCDLLQKKKDLENALCDRDRLDECLSNLDAQLQTEKHMSEVARLQLETDNKEAVMALEIILREEKLVYEAERQAQEADKKQREAELNQLVAETRAEREKLTQSVELEVAMKLYLQDQLNSEIQSKAMVVSELNTIKATYDTLVENSSARISSLEQSVERQVATKLGLETQLEFEMRAKATAENELGELRAHVESSSDRISSLEQASAAYRSECLLAQNKLAEIRSAITGSGTTGIGGDGDVGQIAKLAKGAQDRIEFLEAEIAKKQAEFEELEELRSKDQRNSRKLSKALSERDTANETIAHLEAEKALAIAGRDEAIALKEMADNEKLKLHAELAGHGE